MIFSTSSGGSEAEGDDEDAYDADANSEPEIIPNKVSFNEEFINKESSLSETFDLIKGRRCYEKKFVTRSGNKIFF